MFTIGKSWRAACAVGFVVASAVAAVARAEEGAAPIVLAEPAGLDAAVGAIEAATGARATRLHGRTASVPATEGRAFQLDTAVAKRLLEGSREPFRKAGLFLFRHERSFGLADEKDVVGVLVTRDWRAAVRRIGTAGVGVTTDRIVAWLEALAKDEPFELTEVGLDYVAGRFERAPKNPAALARRIADFAPDLVRGHKEPITGLSDLIARERVLYLIWD
jgi:Domain of unknown function (DUF4253)